MNSAIPTTPLELITNAGLETKIVVALLLLLSLYSWGIMLAKWIEFRGMSKASQVFLREFSRAQTLEQAVGMARKSPASPFNRVFARAVNFLQDAGGRSGGPLRESQVEAMRLLLDAEVTTERDALGRFIPSLAVIGSASPLIGLLGTVLGVIDAFIGVATKGSGNLGAVAPGVAEALIATAAALAVAIPAVFAYNIFAAKLNRFDGELEGFGSEVIALMAREGRV